MSREPQSAHPIPFAGQPSEGQSPAGQPPTTGNTADATSHRPVDISFDCLPLRSFSRLDPPLDASPGLAAKWNRIKHAIEQHGTYNTYYLHNAHCRFFVTNDPNCGMLDFQFEGVVFTDQADLVTRHAILQVSLVRENVPWLEQHVVKWFQETVNHAVCAEFDRYIGVGDLQRTRARYDQLQKKLEESGGFVGMHL
jgi:hypothetical protein